jgi:hypothetical protein
MPEQGPPLSFAQILPIYTDYTVIMQASLSTKVTDRAAPQGYRHQIVWSGVSGLMRKVPES